MLHPSLPPTTHTVEMAQVAELNEQLASRPAPSAITAATLGMGGVRLHAAGVAGLPETAVLVRLSWQGSPEFPDVYGHFGPGEGESFVALMHTAGLNTLCHELHVRQTWGVGPQAGSGSTHS